MNLTKYIVFLACCYCVITDAVGDFSKLYQAEVLQVVYPTTVEQIQKIVRQALDDGDCISIAGARYSQGGQSFGKNTINIDLSLCNKIVELDVAAKKVVVQPGVTWEQLQNYIHPYNLSVQVMQSSNVFSVGGSVSVNVHGRDLRYGPIIQTIESCTIVDWQGNIKVLSRTENPELFSLVVGGYGLFGVIVAVQLHLTDNVVCYKDQVVMPYEQYIDHFKNEILSNSAVNLYYARLSIVPGKKFLKEVVSVAYKVDSKRKSHKIPQFLVSEKNIDRNRALFDFYRQSSSKFIKLIRSFLEKYWYAPWENDLVMHRNQLMCPYIHCLENRNKNSTDFLQEYFIPLEYFVQFTDFLAYWSDYYSINLLNVTLRFVPQNTENILSYAQQDSIAFVLFFSTQLDQQSLGDVEKYTQKLVDACHVCHGTFYLPYQRFALIESVYCSYPSLDAFIAYKKIYDPQQLFINDWWTEYLSTNS